MTTAIITPSHNNTYKATLCLANGRGSSAMTEPGDIIMNANFKLTLVSGVGESPKSHRELVLRGAYELNKRFKEWVCSDDFGDVCKCPNGSVPAEVITDRMQETS